MGFIGVLSEDHSVSDTVMAVQEEEPEEEVQQEMEFEPEDTISMTELKSFSSGVGYGSSKKDDDGKKGMDGKVIGLWILGVLCVVLLGIVLWNRGKTCTQKEKDAIRDTVKAEQKKLYADRINSLENANTSFKAKIRKVLENDLSNFSGKEAILGHFDSVK